jgi:hypothetical protein
MLSLLVNIILVLCAFCAFVSELHSI